MTSPPDPNTQAILLLTAPLCAVAGRDASEPLSLGEYNSLALALHEAGRSPTDLLGIDADTLMERCRGALDAERLRRLLARGFAPAQSWARRLENRRATRRFGRPEGPSQWSGRGPTGSSRQRRRGNLRLRPRPRWEEWQARGIQVVSRAESRYPKRLRERLERLAPPLLYCCGELSLAERGGLAIVGSRSATDDDLAFARATGALAASAGRVVVSGGARGVDRAAMRGALDAGGQVVGVLADGLARAAVDRSHRDALQSGRLLLLSIADPAAGFHVGLVVQSGSGKGGTWTGAVEQLDKLRLVPVFVRITGEAGKGLRALRDRGALPWPEPRNAAELENACSTAPTSNATPARVQGELPFGTMAVREPTSPSVNPSPEPPPCAS